MCLWLQMITLAKTHICVKNWGSSVNTFYFMSNDPSYLPSRLALPYPILYKALVFLVLYIPDCAYKLWGALPHQLCITSVFCALPLHLSALTRYFFFKRKLYNYSFAWYSWRRLQIIHPDPDSDPCNKIFPINKIQESARLWHDFLKCMFKQPKHQACQLLSRPITQLFHTIPHHFFAYFLGWPNDRGNL